MGEAGILTEDDRVELIDGQIIEMSPVGGPHLHCVGRLTRLFVSRTTPDVLVSVQSPVRLTDDTEPEPDLALVRTSDEERVPRAADVLLLVEVSDTTLEKDREVKLPRYAAAGLPEVWIVNLPDDRLEVYRQPAPGGYDEHLVVRRGEEADTRLGPFSAEEILP